MTPLTSLGDWRSRPSVNAKLLSSAALFEKAAAWCALSPALLADDGLPCPHAVTAALMVRDELGKDAVTLEMVVAVRGDLMTRAGV